MYSSSCSGVDCVVVSDSSSESSASASAPAQLITTQQRNVHYQLGSSVCTYMHQQCVQLALRHLYAVNTYTADVPGVDIGPHIDLCAKSQPSGKPTWGYIRHVLIYTNLTQSCGCGRGVAKIKLAYNLVLLMDSSDVHHWCLPHSLWKWCPNKRL